MLESAQELTGDARLFGVKMQYEAHAIPAGYAAAATNLRFNKGVAETRKGVVFLPWMNKLVAGAIQPWTTVYGVGAFRDPATQREYVLIAADGAVYYTSPGNPPQSLTLPGSTTITAACKFVQCFDVVLLLRGLDAAPLAMFNLVDGFTLITQTDTGDGTLTIPNAETGLSAANRLFLVDGDSVLASDLFNYTRYSLLNELRINEGSEDKLVAIGLFGKSTLIALKSLSVYRIDGVYGDLSSTTLSRVTERYGCVAPESAVDLGTDFVWLSHDGIASLTLTQQNEIQAAQGAQQGKWPMFSDDIKPLMDRINWQYAATATAAFNDGKYYLAVPLDDAERLGPELLYLNRANTGGHITITGLVIGASYRFAPSALNESLACGSVALTIAGDFVAPATTATISLLPSNFALGTLKRLYKGLNNAVLVFDTQSGPGGAWCGYDESTEITVSKFFQASYLGRRRLFFLDADGWIKLYEEDYEDALAQPYANVFIAATPAVGNTLRVNGGTLVTAIAGDNNVIGGNWGRNFPQANLLSDVGDQGGYSPSATAPWTCPGAVPLAEVDSAGVFSVRFLATNGVVPTIVYTGVWATITQHATTPVLASLLTRGYAQPDRSNQRFRWLVLDLEAWAATYTLDLVPEGVSTTQSITRTGVSEFSYDRTVFDRPFDEPAFAVGNPDGRFLQAYRQDYSIVPAGSTFALKPSVGICGNLHQAHHEAFRVSTPARAPQLLITTTTGRLRLSSIKFKSTPAPDEPGSK